MSKKADRTLAVKSNLSLSGATNEPLWSASPSSFLSEKLSTWVAVWLFMVSLRRCCWEQFWEKVIVDPPFLQAVQIGNPCYHKVKEQSILASHVAVVVLNVSTPDSEDLSFSKTKSFLSFHASKSVTIQDYTANQNLSTFSPKCKLTQDFSP